jgi:tetratricopeptide (TPR) repeat protein
VTEPSKAPDLLNEIKLIIYEQTGLTGLAVLALLVIAFFVWSNWDKVRTWPGIAWLVARRDRKPIPIADPDRFSVAIARLEGDTPDREQEGLIQRLAREFEGIQVLGIDRAISIKGTAPEALERAGHDQAREYLRASGASILIWGGVLELNGKKRPDLYLTAGDNGVNRPRQYTLESENEIRLPKIFWEDLSNVLGLVIASQSTEFEALSGHYVADRLKLFIDRVRSVIAAAGDTEGWDAQTLARARLLLGNVLCTFGEQKGDAKLLEEAVTFYRAALTEWAQEREPRNWAGTQNNLGNALKILGERESGTALLEEAVNAYRAALIERTREQVPLGWAMTQNNLGNALKTLGERESGTARLEEAVDAYRAALTERTREQVPLDWARTQNNLGAALQALGARESGTARLEEAVGAYRAALEVLHEAGAAHYIAGTEDNLKRVEALIAERRRE